MVFGDNRQVNAEVFGVAHGKSVAPESFRPSLDGTEIAGHGDRSTWMHAAVVDPVNQRLHLPGHRAVDHRFDHDQTLRDVSQLFDFQIGMIAVVEHGDGQSGVESQLAKVGPVGGERIALEQSVVSDIMRRHDEVGHSEAQADQAVATPEVEQFLPDQMATHLRSDQSRTIGKLLGDGEELVAEQTPDLLGSGRFMRLTTDDVEDLFWQRTPRLPVETQLDQDHLQEPEGPVLRSDEGGLHRGVHVLRGLHGSGPPWPEFRIYAANLSHFFRMIVKERRLLFKATEQCIMI